MKALKVLLILIILFLLPISTAMESTQECLNSSHLETSLIWTECDGTCTDKNITQLVNCTSGCDSTVDQCRYERESDIGNLTAILVLSFITGMFFFLGIKVQPDEQFALLKNGMQTLFFLLGLWLIILDIGLAETIAVSSGVSENTLNLMGSGIVAVTYGIYIIMVLIMLSYLYSVLWLMLPEKTKSKLGRKR